MSAVEKCEKCGQVKSVDIGTVEVWWAYGNDLKIEWYSVVKQKIEPPIFPNDN